MNFMKVSEEEPTQTHLNTAQSDSNMIVESFQKSNEAFRMMNCQEQPLEVINNK